MKYLALARRGPRLTLLKRWLGCIRYHGVSWLPLELLAGVGYLVRRLGRVEHGRA